MIPLRVEARLGRVIVNPSRRIALDALLAAAVAQRDQLPPPVDDLIVPIEIPVQRSACGRFHLASFSEQEVERREKGYIHKKSIVDKALVFGSKKITRIQTTAGPNKDYRIPIEKGHLVGDRLVWWCIGDVDEIRALLATVHHLGKRRAVGYGRVLEWLVEPCEPWGDGFPVLRDGRPLRPLPVDHEGVSVRRVAMGALSYPYWQRERWEEVLVP